MTAQIKKDGSVIVIVCWSISSTLMFVAYGFLPGIIVSVASFTIIMEQLEFKKKKR